MIGRSPASATPPSPKGRTRRPLVTVALMLGMFLAAVEGTIVATAMPSIVAALSGFSLYSWVFSIYLLAEVVTIPVYGKLADLFGRKPVFIAGTSLFLLGTALCGLSRSMHQLILFRAVQGIGSGAVLPLAVTMAGDLYSIQERPRIQSALNSMWALASVIGPTLGGLIVQQLSWHWVFYFNIPFGMAAIAILWLFFHEDVAPSRAHIDYGGSALLVIGVGAFMLILVQGGTAWPWTSGPVIACALGAAAALWLFFRHERRTQEPLLPLDLFEDRIILLCNIGSLLGGGLILGLSSFVPPFVQGVLGASPTRAGATLAFMSIGWPLAGSVSGHVWRLMGHRRTAMLGTGLTVLSGLILVGVGPDSSPTLVGCGTFLMGMGLGFSQTTYVVTVQSRVPWNRRGVATSSNMFGRMLGSSVWVAFLGGILNQRVQRDLAAAPAVLTAYVAEVSARSGLDVVNLLLDPETRLRLPPPLLAHLQSALAGGIHLVFMFVLLTGVAAFILTWNLPRGPLVQEATLGQRADGEGQAE